MTISLTFTGTEIALLTGIMANAMWTLGDDDWEVVDLMLDRALSAMPDALSPDVQAHIAVARTHPADSYWEIVKRFGGVGQPFKLSTFAILFDDDQARAAEMLGRIAKRHPALAKVSDTHWVVQEESHAS